MKKLLFIIFGICVLWVQMSCSRYTPTKAGKQLSRAYQTYPLQVADSAARWYPIVIVDSLIEDTFLEADDSTQFYKDRFDSLQGVKQWEEQVLDTTYRDTCRSAKETYQKGYKTGYGSGLNQGLQDCVPDTILRKRLIVKESTAKLAVERGKKEAAEKEKEKWKQKFYIALGAGIILLILLLVGYLLNRNKK